MLELIGVFLIAALGGGIIFFGMQGQFASTTRRRQDATKRARFSALPANAVAGENEPKRKRAASFGRR
jgi:hypothetical protein